jgi:hypothetical protein
MDVPRSGPADRPPEVLALVSEGNSGLLGSYARALHFLGCNVSYWDPDRALETHTKFGRPGRYAARFVPVDAWILKANREMILAATRCSPDLVLVGGNAPVRAGALAQLRVILPGVRIALLWPDSLLNLSRHVIECLPVYDLVGSYSRASINEIRRLGASNVAWLPFAGDTLLFPRDTQISAEERAKFDSDVCFIGNHRPEREEAIVSLLESGLRVKVWGEPQSWRRHARQQKALGAYFQGTPLFGVLFAKAIRSAKLSLNVIDPTNYPSANMRFFESPMCGGATLNSPCPEMRDTFGDRRAAFYYGAPHDLPLVAKELLRDDALRDSVARTAQEAILHEHTYVHRASELLRLLDVGSGSVTQFPAV